MSEGVRIGQIGCGRHGRLKLARALASVGDADLVSCADLDEGAALRTAREFGFARHYQDYGEMLAEEELDGVVVALPHRRLAEMAVAAANAGCIRRETRGGQQGRGGGTPGGRRQGRREGDGRIRFSFRPGQAHPQVPYRARRSRRDNPGVCWNVVPPFDRRFGWVVHRSEKGRRTALQRRWAHNRRGPMDGGFGSPARVR